MIYCTIGGRTVYPESGTNIKITLENPYLKEEGSHTYEISFPLSIPENRAVFGSVHRYDVSKKNIKYDNCSLFSGSMRVISGIGKVVSYTNEKIKLQIIAETQSGRQKAMEKYIDSIKYPPVAEPYATWCKNKFVYLDRTILNKGYEGIKGKYVFFTVRNTGEEPYRSCLSNAVFEDTGENKLYIWKPALQPNLIYVLHETLAAIGYTVTEDDFDKYPWNNLYITNVKKSDKIEGALPHWKITTFVKEFCNLFNAKIIYDETNGTARIKSFSTVGSADRIDIYPEMEFSSEYDEEGISYIESDDLEYNLQQCEDERSARVVSEDALNFFPIKVYATKAEMYAAAAGMTQKEKLTTIFLCKNSGYWYYRKDEETNIISEEAFGFFTKLIKEREEEEEASTRKLNMVPVSMGIYELKTDIYPHEEVVGRPLIPYVEGPEYNWGETPDQDEYVSVQDVVEDSVSIESQGEDEIMQIAFLSEIKYTYITVESQSFTLMTHILGSFCDQRESTVSQSCSLALTEPGSIVNYIGTFHKKSMQINPHNQIVATFLTNALPDIKAVYCIRNKLFLCAKIEATVDDNGVDQLKKGYFYEIL